jgi:hypothetical protein
VADRKKGRTPATPDRDGYAGEDRRQAAVPDRRAVRRGGRRAGDVSKHVAKFIHQLLPEPPR